jgi:saccharopine dehydrogenase (NAD+, L-lysine-forming)
MSNFIGIRHEDKYHMEKRAPLTPRHVERLVKQKKLDFMVQTSSRRIFSDEEYTRAGAVVVPDLSKCSVIFGVKEMPLDFFEPEKTYVFFAHVVKGQLKNMPMLKRMMELKCNLIDYERVVDEQGKRIIFFGRYAGQAGMINAFWSLGQRLLAQGRKTALTRICQSHCYHSLKEARDAVSSIGQLVAESGILPDLSPFVIGFTGYGNVSLGAQEICGLLPVKEISAEKLLQLQHRRRIPGNIIYKVVFHEEDLYERTDGGPFDLNDYFTNPDLYQSRFEQYVPHLSMLVNCVYWDPRYPKLLTKGYLKQLFADGPAKLSVLADISCDVNGSMESTVKSTEIEDPVYVYEPQTGLHRMGFSGDGLLVMAVDILPAELPRDSSEGFGDVLVNYVKPIADADFDEHFDDLDLPRSVKKALILHKGELTPEYEYLKEYLQ